VVVAVFDVVLRLRTTEFLFDSGWWIGLERIRSVLDLLGCDAAYHGVYGYLVVLLAEEIDAEK
jgi:hypothetical protein